jgi:hypothetical protein
MIKLYEQNGIKVDGKLVSQYLQDKKIAKEFAMYYDLYNKYKSDYQINDILSGKNVDSIIDRAKSAKFDERIALIGLLLDAVYGMTSGIYREEQHMRLLTTELRNVRMRLARESAEIALEALEREKQKVLDQGKRSSSMSKDDMYAHSALIATLGELRTLMAEKAPKDANASFALIKKVFDDKVKAMKDNSVEIGKKLSNAFKFLEVAFGDGQEMLIFVTELTINRYAALFISRYGSTEYFKHNKDLLLYERHKDIIREIEVLDIED